MTQFTIPADALADFYAKMKKLNKKAARLGCAPVVATVVGDIVVEKRHTFKTADGERTRAYKIAAKVIELAGQAPKLEGFEFVARVERTPDEKNPGQFLTLFHTVPGVDVKIDERFRAMDPSTCEHCCMRRVRRDTFVVLETATGKQSQVGRQCLADFTGINSPEKFAAKAAYLSLYTDLENDGERMFGSHFEQTLDVEHALRLTSAYIETKGWVPRSAAPEGGSTAGLVAEHFYLQTKEKRQQSMSAMGSLAEEPRHVERAAQVTLWLRGDLKARARSDYELNLVSIGSQDHVHLRHVGLLCSAVSAWQRATDCEVKYRKRQSDLQASRHVGEVGKRLRDVEVVVFATKILEANEWGPRTMVKFLDKAGNLLTWFASGDREYQCGAAAKITGTVKRHSEYNGVRETQLSRCVVDFLG